MNNSFPFVSLDDSPHFPVTSFTSAPVASSLVADEVVDALQWCYGRRVQITSHRSAVRLSADGITAVAGTLITAAKTFQRFETVLRRGSHE